MPQYDITYDAVVNMSINTPSYPGISEDTSPITNDTEINNWINLIQSFEDGNKVYIRFYNNCFKKNKSVMVLEKVEKHRYNSYDLTFGFETRKDKHVVQLYVETSYKRANSSTGIEWLQNCSGPSFYYTEKAPKLPKEVITTFDFVNREMKIGAFVTFILGESFQFGTITKIKNITSKKRDSRTGDMSFTQTTEVNIRSIPLEEGRSSYDYVIKDHSQIMLMDQETTKFLMLKRLTVGS